MSPAFQNKDFLILPEIKLRKPSADFKTKKTSVNTAFHTKFSGRDSLLKEIHSFYNIALRALSDSGSYAKIIGISGEGGIGKSRLVYEFVKKISPQDSSCIIKINFSDKDNIVFTKDFENLKNYFDKKFSNFTKKNIPAIVIFEDLHWYDAKEKSKIEKLLFAFSGELPIPFRLSVIFMLTYRENNSSFSFKKYDSFEEISLAPFNDKESLQFIQNSSLIRGKKLRNHVLQKIIKLSAGIPFYLEEFLKAFGKNKKVEGIPGSIENLLQYKFSMINEDLLKVMDIMAIWDGSIEKETLKNICDKVHILFSSQKGLEISGLIKAEITRGVESYSFVHDIYKSYILNKIEKNWKIILHKSIAVLLEKEREKSEHSLYRLFYHYKNAEEFEQAFDYLEKHLNKIIEQREFEIALQHIDELIEYYSYSEYKKLDIWLLKIRCLRMLIRSTEMESELKEVKLQIDKSKDIELLLKYLWLLAEYYLLSNNFTKAFRIINKGLKITGFRSNLEMEAEFRFLLMRNLNTNGKTNECLKEAEKLLKVSSIIKSKKFYFWAKYFMAVNFQALQNYEESNSIVDDLLFLAKNEKEYFFLNLFNKVKAKYYFEIKNYYKFLDVTREQYRLDLSIRDTHLSIQTLFNLSDCLIKLGKMKEAQDILNSILSFSLKNNSLLFEKRACESLLNLYLYSDLWEEAAIIGEKLLKTYDRNDYRSFFMLYYNLLEIYFSLGDINKCYNCYKKSLLYSKKMNKLNYVPFSHYNMGYAYYLSGEAVFSRKFIVKAYNGVKKNLKLDFANEIIFTYAEIFLVQQEVKKSVNALKRFDSYFKGRMGTPDSYFFEIFSKLLENSDNQKKFEEFLNSEKLSIFLFNKDITELAKLKIFYFILIISNSLKLDLTKQKLNECKQFIDINLKTNNKIMKFYLNQISLSK